MELRRIMILNTQTDRKTCSQTCIDTQRPATRGTDRQKDKKRQEKYDKPTSFHGSHISRAVLGSLRGTF